MPSKRVTIHHLAEYCHVSTGTVSRVLNNTGRFSKETRERVEEAIRVLGYVPNNAAVSLRRTQSRVVGIFVNTLTYETISSVVSQLQNALIDQNYTPIICNIGMHAEREDAYYAMMQSMQACAIFMIFLRTGHQTVRRLDIPTIYIYKNPFPAEEVADQYVIETDDFQAGESAANELIRCGCRRLGFIRFTLPRNSVPMGRQIGFLNALYKQNVPYDDAMSIEVEESSFYCAFNTIMEKLSTGVVADGYFCATDLLALSLVRALESRKLRVPEDVKVIGCNNLEAAMYNNRQITTIGHQLDVICGNALDLLARIMAGEEIPPEVRRQRIGVTLIRRDTT